MDHPHVLPRAVVAVLARVGRVEVVDVEVFLVDREDRQAEGDGLVVADRNAGQGRLARADHVKARRLEVHDVAQRGHAQRPVRVVGQDRPAGRRARGRDHPVVGAFRGGAVGQLSQRLAVDRRRLLGWRGELHVARAELVVREHVGRDDARIEAAGDPGGPGRLELVAQQVGVQPGGAGYLGAGDLGEHVAAQGMAADAHDVLRLPQVRLARGELEFHRQRQPPGAHLAHIGVDAGDERLRPALRLGSIGRPLGRHVAAIEEKARGAILLGVAGAEAGGEQAKPALAPQVDLPEPVARGVPALQEEGVALGRRLDMRHAPLVDQDRRRRLQAGHGERMVSHSAGRFGGGRGGAAAQPQDSQSRNQPTHAQPSRFPRRRS